MAGWRDEHGEEYAVPSVIETAEGFVDESWHNDTCPRFAHNVTEKGITYAHVVTIWIEHPEIKQREFEEAVRFIVEYASDFTPNDIRPVFTEADNVAPHHSEFPVLYYGDDPAQALRVAVEACGRIHRTLRQEGRS